MKKKIIKVFLKPSDFVGNSFGDSYNCPLARACKRHFKTKYASVGWATLDLEDKKGNDVGYTINNKFGIEDYEYVKEAYEKAPKKDQYYVELIKQ